MEDFDRDDIHDELSKAYVEYFKMNDWWERKRSIRAYYAVQQTVRRIRKLAKLRNQQIKAQHDAKKEARKNK
jgi:hypothetical protein